MCRRATGDGRSARESEDLPKVRAPVLWRALT
jgi:hypothetical protein